MFHLCVVKKYLQQLKVEKYLYNNFTSWDLGVSFKNYFSHFLDSPEELNDLKSAYLDSEGNMDEIIDSVLCATIDDEARFTKILKGLIKKKEIPDFPAFSKEGKTKKSERKRKVRY